MSKKSGFHEGEHAVQERAGRRDIADRNAAVITDTVIAGARTFINKQFMVVVGSADTEGNLWSSMLFGKPGFLRTEDGKSISIEIPAGERDDADPFWRNIGSNASIGMLFIELGTRRRYRVNGSITSNTADRIEVGVREAYPNCPKYIQRRHLRDLEATGKLPGTMAQGNAIKGSIETILRQADTLFIASLHTEGGLDASHRGGAPGFILRLNDDTLRIPDYPGNCLFNTLGNIEVNPHAGMCVPDFSGNRLLHLSGEATIRWDMDDPAGQTGGTKRFWDFKVKQWILRDIPQRLAWEYLDASPFNPPVTSQEGAGS